MSINLSLFALSPSRLAALASDGAAAVRETRLRGALASERWWIAHYGDLSAAEAVEKHRADLRAQILSGGDTPTARGVIAEFDAVDALADAARAAGDAEPAFELAKEWGWIDQALTQSPPEAAPPDAPARFLMTGREVGTDVGYGPPRLHTPEAVADFAVFLAGWRAGPAGAALTGEDGPLIDALAAYVAAAAQRGDGMLLWMS